MSTPDPGEKNAPQEPAAAEAGAVIEETRREVALQRSVRYGRILIGATVLGALIAALACLVFPIAEDAEYTMGQVVGFMVLIGGAVGLGIGGILSLILGLVAKRQRGTGVAIQADVR